MGIFKDTRKRNIFIYIISGLMVIASAVIICIAVWPRKEDTPETPKNTQPAQQQEPQQEQSTSDGPLYTIVPCEEAAAVTGEECPPKTETPSYPSYTPNYSTPEPTTAPAQTPQYSAPTPEQVTAPAVDCNSYHAQYYNIYLQNVESAQRAYTTSLESASMECAARSGAQSGCTGIAKKRLQQELESKISNYKIEYEQNMINASCAHAIVDF